VVLSGQGYLLEGETASRSSDPRGSPAEPASQPRNRWFKILGSCGGLSLLNPARDLDALAATPLVVLGRDWSSPMISGG
jgi:hypothetical protein